MLRVWKKIGKITLFSVQSNNHSCNSGIQKWLQKPRGYIWCFCAPLEQSQENSCIFLLQCGRLHRMLMVSAQLLLAGQTHVILSNLNVIAKADWREIKTSDLWEEFLFFCLLKNKLSIAEEDISRALLVLFQSKWDYNQLLPDYFLTLKASHLYWNYSFSNRFIILTFHPVLVL